MMKKYEKGHIDDITKINIEAFYEKTINMICELIDQYLPSLPGFPKNEMIESIKSAMEKKGKEIEQKEIKYSDFKATNLESILKKVGLNEEMLPGMLNGFLEASNYYPDKAKLKQKKNVVIDQDDMAHANYCVFFNIFVSNDRRLKQRLSAVQTNLKFMTKIMSFDEFIEELKEEYAV